MNAASVMTQNPTTTFRKNSNTPPTSNVADDFSKRMPHVDTLSVNKEKKNLFDKVVMEEEYYPFGTPGIRSGENLQCLMIH